jgi:hypothetical protein
MLSRKKFYRQEGNHKSSHSTYTDELIRFFKFIDWYYKFEKCRSCIIHEWFKLIDGFVLKYTVEMERTEK